MNVRSFFAINYFTYFLVFALQIVIVRLCGAEVFGAYTVYLSMMAIVEAPIITARSDSALKMLNASDSLSKTIWVCFKKDLISSLLIAPLIILLLGFYFDFLIGFLAALCLIFQSGFSALKNYFVVVHYRAIFTLAEAAIACAILILLIFVTLISKSLIALIYFYTFAALLKSLLIFSLFFILNRNEKPNKTILGNGVYKAFSSILILRHLAINLILNTDILILSMYIDLKQLASYKIVKSICGIIFRMVAPLWRWKMFDINMTIKNKEIGTYKNIQSQGLLLVSLVMGLALFQFDNLAVLLAKVVYGINIREEGLPLTLMFLYIVSTLWFVSWYKIDMLYRSNKYLTLLIPSSLAFFQLIVGSFFFISLESFVTLYSLLTTFFVLIVSIVFFMIKEPQ